MIHRMDTLNSTSLPDRSRRQPYASQQSSRDERKLWHANDEAMAIEPRHTCHDPTRSEPEEEPSPDDSQEQAEALARAWLDPPTKTSSMPIPCPRPKNDSEEEMEGYLVEMYNQSTWQMYWRCVEFECMRVGVNFWTHFNVGVLALTLAHGTPRPEKGNPPSSHINPTLKLRGQRGAAKAQ